MSSNLAIKVDRLSKCYQIYETPRDRLKQFILPRFQRAKRQYFREFWALEDVSFEIHRGETVGIIGRNGSGKSTLLQLICGTSSPTSGTVEASGRIAALLELGSGFNPEFTGRENVYLNASLLGLTKEEVDSRFEDIASFADIGLFIEQPVKTYSSGMFVRLAFAVNILSEPQIMVVDEALSVGDMAFQAKCMTALKRIQDSGATVLFVSHDIGALKGLCSRGIYLEKGRVRDIGEAGNIAELYTRAMREEMNKEHIVSRSRSKPGQTSNVIEQASEPLEQFKASKTFDERVHQFRYGEGGVRITYAELLDDRLRPTSSLVFDQAVNVRIFFESAQDDEISCNYYIADSKKTLILGSGLRIAGHPFMKVKRGGKYSITYTTRLPLQEGEYSIQLQITRPVVLDEASIFLDVIEDAIVFKMARRSDAQIWTKVHIPNEVKSVCY